MFQQEALTSELFYRSRKRLLWGIALCLLCFFTTYISHSFSPYPITTTLTAGLALGGLAVGGIMLWPAVLLGSLIGGLLGGISVVSAISFAFAYTLAALAGVYLLQKLDFDAKFGRLRDVIAFLTVTSAAATIVPITLILENLHNDTLGLSFGEQWISATISMLVLGSLIIRWSLHPHKRTKSTIAESAITMGFTAGIAFLLSWGGIPSVGSVSLIYVLLIPLFWTSLRLGPRMMTLALFLVATISVSDVVFTMSALVPTSELGTTLFQSELLITVLFFIFFILVATEEERKEAMKTLQSHITELEQGLEQTKSSEREKIEFLALLTHELRNPLSPIVSSLELLKTKGLRQKNGETLIYTIDRHTKIMAKLLDDLLDVTRISRKRLKIDREPIQLQAAISGAMETSLPLAKSKNHTIVTELPSSPVMVEGDMVRLTQILGNILLNAAKYTDPNGTITIKCFEKNDTAYIEVSDTGIGIAEGMLDRIFKPFTQVNDSSGRPGSGLGIGLSLTKQLVELHNGQIAVKSAGHQLGSTFTVELPTTTRMPLPFNADTKNYTPHQVRHSDGQKKIHVLVVDDNEAAAEGLNQLLEHYGFTVTLAHDGTTALEHALKLKPDVLLLDIGLPDMSGYEVAEHITQQCPKTPLLIALTGYGQEEDQEKTKRAGIKYHLTKPVGIQEIISIIKRNFLREAC